VIGPVTISRPRTGRRVGGCNRREPRSLLQAGSTFWKPLAPPRAPVWGVRGEGGPPLVLLAQRGALSDESRVHPFRDPSVALAVDSLVVQFSGQSEPGPCVTPPLPKGPLGHLRLVRVEFPEGSTQGKIGSSRGLSLFLTLSRPRTVRFRGRRVTGRSYAQHERAHRQSSRSPWWGPYYVPVSMFPLKQCLSLHCGAAGAGGASPGFEARGQVRRSGLSSIRGAQPPYQPWRCNNTSSSSSSSSSSRPRTVSCLA
jgi:hypothetical protein